MLIHDDNYGAVACLGVQGDGVGPGTGQVYILIATLGGNLDAVGVLSSVGADGCLNVSDGHVRTIHMLLCQRLKGLREGLVVKAEVAVAGRTTLVGDGLADGTQVMLHVHLHHLEDSLAYTSLRGVIRAGRHGWSCTGKCLAVNCVIGDTVDGTC